VGSLARFYKLTVENILVAHDDVDLPLGIIRIRPGGSSAGQKGIASIIERLGTQEFPRLRIGIGRPPGSKLAVAYVLQDFSRDESEIVQFILERAANATLSFVTDGLEKAMNQYNGRADGGDDVVDDVGT
jgi:PTH1 family peptidyl-tRNA hydrolase